MSSSGGEAPRAKKKKKKQKKQRGSRIKVYTWKVIAGVCARMRASLRDFHRDSARCGNEEPERRDEGGRADETKQRKRADGGGWNLRFYT